MSRLGRSNFNKVLKRVGHHEKLRSQGASEGRTPLNMSFTPLLETQKGGNMWPLSRDALWKREQIFECLSSLPLFIVGGKGFLFFFLSGLSKHTFTTNKQRQKRGETLAFHPSGLYGASLTVKRLSKYTTTNRNGEQRLVPVSTSEGFLEKKKKKRRKKLPSIPLWLVSKLQDVWVNLEVTHIWSLFPPS